MSENDHNELDSVKEEVKEPEIEYTASEIGLSNDIKNVFEQLELIKESEPELYNEYRTKMLDGALMHYRCNYYEQYNCERAKKARQFMIKNIGFDPHTKIPFKELIPEMKELVKFRNEHVLNNHGSSDIVNS